MNRKEYSIYKLELSSMLLDYQIENDIDDDWFLRLLLDVSQRHVVRFEDDD